MKKWFDHGRSRSKPGAGDSGESSASSRSSRGTEPSRSSHGGSSQGGVSQGGVSVDSSRAGRIPLRLDSADMAASALAGLAFENQSTVDSVTVIDGIDSAGNLLEALSTPCASERAARTSHRAPGILPQSYVVALLALDENILERSRDCLARGDPSRQLSGVRAIRAVARDHPSARAAVAAAGAAKALLLVLKERDPRLVQEALQALVNLTCDCPQNLRLIPGLSLDALDLVVRQLEVEDEGVQETAAELVFSLSLDNANKVELNNTGATVPLIALLSSTPAVRRVACKALFNIALAATCRASIVEAGAVPVLLFLAADTATETSRRVAEKALLVLKMLVTIPMGWETIGDSRRAHSTLIAALDLPSPAGQDAALSVLLEMATRCRQAREDIRLEDPFPAIYRLTQGPDPRLRRKAVDLQRLLSAA